MEGADRRRTPRAVRSEIPAVEDGAALCQTLPSETHGLATTQKRAPLTGLPPGISP
jgi:hypothetical protein